MKKVSTKLKFDLSEVPRGVLTCPQSVEIVLILFRFIDWLMELPEALRQQFRLELEQYEQERQMPYITIDRANGTTGGAASTGNQAVAGKSAVRDDICMMSWRWLELRFGWGCCWADLN